VKWQKYSETSKPRPGQMILVIGRDRDTARQPQAYFKRFQSVAQYRGDGKLIIKEPVYPYGTQITHWQPLPSYPEDGRWQRFKSWMKNLFNE
jgi:hypothetical protein